MGSGIALLPSNLAALGSVTFISWILASIGAICLAIVYAKLSKTDPQEGGPIGYASEVAPILGFQTGVLYFNANWIGNLAIAITGVSYLSKFFPDLTNPIPAGIVTIIIIWFFTFLNFYGTKWIGKLVTIGVALLLIPVILTGTIGWIYFDKNIFLENWNVTSNTDTHTVFSGIILCIWSFIGVESASVDTSLVKNPSKTIPRATLIGVFIAALVYFLSSTAISGMFPHETIINSGAPFSLSSSYLFGNWAGHIVSIIIAFACLASLGSWMMLVAEAARRGANDGNLPKIFAKTNNNNIPTQGLIFISSLMSIVMLFFMFNTSSTNKLFSEIITIAVLLTILPYFYSALNLIDIVEYPLKKITATMVSLISILFCFTAYIGSSHYTLISVVIISLGSLIFYVKKDREEFEKNIYKNIHNWNIADKN